MRDEWADAFTSVGASQCGFCTPGIIMRLAALGARRDAPTTTPSSALCSPTCAGARDGGPSSRRLARSTASDDPGYHGSATGAPARRDLRRGGSPGDARGGRRPGGGSRAWRVGAGALPRTPPPPTRWWRCPTAAAVGPWRLRSAEARARAERVPGRNSTVALRHPLEVPPGAWDLTLRTTFVEPAYLEPDASWCVPGGEPVTPLANGGAFGGKRSSPVGAVARRLADETGRPVRVVFSREDVVRLGPKRPPIAAGVRADGSGVVRVGRTPGSPDLAPWAQAVASVAPGLVVEEVAVAGPPVSADLRAAGWAEAAVLLAALEAGAARGPGAGSSRDGAVARRAPPPPPPSPPTGTCRCRCRRASPSTTSSCAPMWWVPPTRPWVGSAAKGWPSTSPAPCSTSPSGPSGSSRPATCRRSRSWWRTIPDPRWRWGIPSSLLSPRRHGWRPGFLGRGPSIREVAREYSGRAVLAGGARRAMAGVLGTARHRTGRRRTRAGGGRVRGPGPTGPGQRGRPCCGAGSSAGATW